MYHTATELFRQSGHFTQIDPDPRKKLSEKTLDIILSGGTDATIVAGTQNVTEKAAIRAIRLLADKTDVPVYFAPSNPGQVGDAVLDLLNGKILEGMLIYHPLNHTNPIVNDWLKDWEERLEKETVDLTDYLVNVGYVIATNPKSAVGKFLKPSTDRESIINSAKSCEYSTLYLEGSGKKVPLDLISEVRLVYGDYLLVGGGLMTQEDVEDAGKSGANGFVLGKILEEGRFKDYRNTVKAARAFARPIVKI